MVIDLAAQHSLSCIRCAVDQPEVVAIGGVGNAAVAAVTGCHCANAQLLHENNILAMVNGAQVIHLHRLLCCLAAADSVQGHAAAVITNSSAALQAALGEVQLRSRLCEGNIGYRYGNVVLCAVQTEAIASHLASVVSHSYLSNRALQNAINIHLYTVVCAPDHIQLEGRCSGRGCLTQHDLFCLQFVILNDLQHQTLAGVIIDLCTQDFLCIAGCAVDDPEVIAVAYIRQALDAAGAYRQRGKLQGLGEGQLLTVIYLGQIVHLQALLAQCGLQNCAAAVFGDHGIAVQLAGAQVLLILDITGQAQVHLILGYGRTLIPVYQPCFETGYLLIFIGVQVQVQQGQINFRNAAGYLGFCTVALAGEFAGSQVQGDRLPVHLQLQSLGTLMLYRYVDLALAPSAVQLAAGCAGSLGKAEGHLCLPGLITFCNSAVQGHGHFILGSYHEAGALSDDLHQNSVPDGRIAL